MIRMIERELPRGGAAAPIVLGVAVLGFAGLIIFLIVSALSPGEAATFDPSPIELIGEAPPAGFTDTVTIAAYDGWQFFDFERGSVVLPPDTTGWDLMLRRFSIVPARLALDLDTVGFDTDIALPADGWSQSTFGRDTVNAALDRWYTYSMLSHLLEPNGHTYVIRTTADRVVTIEFLGYYCTGMVAGCPTFRYRVR